MSGRPAEPSAAASLRAGADVIAFNRGRLMMLPQTISKGSGVREALAALRRRTGLPHRIVLDEAHYFLHEPGATRLLDLELNGYTLVTYRASRLSRAVLEASLAPRLTPHVRHRQKYVDVPVGDAQAFVFHTNGRLPTSRVRTLREFVAVLDSLDVTQADGYLRRGDFSRWIGDVFGDRALARELQKHEREYVDSGSGNAVARIAAAVKSRYELAAEPDMVLVQ